MSRVATDISRVEYCDEQTCLCDTTPHQLLDDKRSWADGHSRLYVMQLFGGMLSVQGEEPRILQVRHTLPGREGQQRENWKSKERNEQPKDRDTLSSRHLCFMRDRT